MRLCVAVATIIAFSASSASAHGITDNELTGLGLDKGTRLARTAQDKQWCGDFGGAPSSEANQINIVIANPAGSTIRNEALANLINDAVDKSNSHLLAASDGSRIFRFARNPNCPDNPIEIKALNLTTSLAEMKLMTGRNAAYEVNQEINQNYNRRPGANKQLVVINGYNAPEAAGYGFISFGQAVAFAGNSGDTSVYNLAYVLSHELMHVLGAVNPRAPHGSPGMHCFEENDLMCYDDGTLPQPLISHCSAPSGQLPPIDCGKDDYFSANPASDSFLGQNPQSNVYNSAYLLNCQQSREVCVAADKPKLSDLQSQRIDVERILISATITSQEAGSYYFLWRDQGGQQKQSPAVNFSGGETIKARHYLADLRPGHQYRWQLVANNRVGQTMSEEASLTTPTQTIDLSRLRASYKGARIITFSFRASASGQVIVSVGPKRQAQAVEAGLNRGRIKVSPAARGRHLTISAGDGYNLLGRQGLKLPKRPIR